MTFPVPAQRGSSDEGPRSALPLTGERLTDKADSSGMTSRLDQMPAGYGACVWCGAGNRLDASGVLPVICFNCGLNPQPGEDLTKGGKVDPKAAQKSSRNKKSDPIQRKLSRQPIGQPVVGVDPGARYTGVVVRDGDAVLHSSTLVRPQEMASGTEWALSVIAQLRVILADFPAMMPMGIEGISDPKGFQHGKKAAINPKDIIRAGIVLGAVVATWPTAVIIDPGNNGSQHYSHYPAELIGRRPADLPGAANGAGTRNHEQSAFDVAGKAASVFYPKASEPLDFA